MLIESVLIVRDKKESVVQSILTKTFYEIKNSDMKVKISDEDNKPMKDEFGRYLVAFDFNVNYSYVKENDPRISQSQKILHPVQKNF
jgi:hypothetical protein